MFFLKRSLFVLVGLMLVSPVSAQEVGEVAFHGFGTWISGQTDGNNYYRASDQGTYDNHDWVLNISANPYENLKVIAQPHISSEAGEIHSDLEYAFAKWRLDDALDVRMGKIPHPFGIYTEVIDVGVLRPFLSLPQGVYGEGAGFVAEGYSGLGFSGFFQMGSAWELKYDLYGGHIATGIEHTEPGEALGGDAGHGAEAGLDDALGARVIVATPVDGLRFGASAFTGKMHNEERAVIHGV